MDSTTLCALAGPVISIVVSALKKISIIKRYPKLTSMFISAILGSVVSIHGSYNGISYADIFTCIMIQFSGSVGFHEAVTNQVQKVLPIGTDDGTPPTANPNDFGRPGSL